MVWTDRRLTVGLLLTLAAIALVTQAALFQRQGLWADEVFSLAMATGHSLEHPASVADPAKGDFVQGETAKTAAEWRRYLEHETPAAGPARVVRAVFLSDTSPPLYYLMLYGWTRVLGATDLTLRAFSAVWAMACLPLLVAVGSRIGSRRGGLIAATLFVVSPPAVYYFAEGRMYSLLWFCVLITGYATLVLQQDRASRRWQFVWIIGSAAGLLVHYFFLFPWTAMVGWLLLTPGNDRRWAIVGRIAVVGALILPWYLHLPESLHAWRITKDWLNETPSGIRRLAAARDLLLQFISGRTLALWAIPRWAEVVAIVAVAGAAVIATMHLRWRAFNGPRLLLWLWLLAAWSGPLAIDAVRRTFTAEHSRYAIAALPAALLLIGGALAAVPVRGRIVVLAAIVATWSVGTAGIYRWRWRSGGATREVAAAVTRANPPGDLVLVHSIPSGLLAVAYYAEPSARLAPWIGQLGTRRVPESVERLIAGSRRIQFVRIHDVGEPAPEEAWLRAHALVAREGTIGKIPLIEFRPKYAEHF